MLLSAILTCIGFLTFFHKNFENKDLFFKLTNEPLSILVGYFSGRVDAGGEVTLNGRSIPKVDKFKYLGSIIQQHGDINEDINQRIIVGWKKWNYTSGMLCDKRVPLGLKGKVYRMVVRSAALYGSECWPLKKTQVQRLMVAEMRMIRWMRGFTRIDRIRNWVIRDLAKVAPIEDKMRETRLRWFGHVIRRRVEALVRRYEIINIPEGKRGGDWSKKSLDEVIREDLKVIGLADDLAQDRRLWRDRIKILDCKESARSCRLFAVT